MVSDVPGVPLIGVVDDASGNMVAVGVDGPQIVIGWNPRDYRVFEPSQIVELIDHLTNARLDALDAQNAADDE